MKRELEVFKSQVPTQPKTKENGVKENEVKETEILAFSKDPDSLNDILRDLVKVDPVIKASALVKRDGSLLAAAISSVVSDSLVATIATTVLNIARTILSAMEGGELRSITIQGDDGIVLVSPILSDFCLVILTGSTSKKGVIEVMARQVEKSVKKYLNLE